MLFNCDCWVLKVYRKLYGLDNLDIAGENDGHRDDEAKHVDVEDIGHVHHWVLASYIPFNTTTGTGTFETYWKPTTILASHGDCSC
jgi:hypothetical protein